eukprot:TRINITY_DN1993_c0_g1_i8.p1 TRINITY_DN1993_c0_g1~~TRINITY_DN1993_c0_g1_i8.p1  ORF type:complete len:100 (-),score=10.68 TRINITY_DN1993_c0_g1_i8:60-359(-)
MHIDSEPNDFNANVAEMENTRTLPILPGSIAQMNTDEDLQGNSNQNTEHQDITSSTVDNAGKSTSNQVKLKEILRRVKELSIDRHKNCEISQNLSLIHI